MRKTAGLLLTGLCGLTLFGCGGGGGSSVTPPGASSNPLTAGREALNKVASGASSSDTQTFQSILDQFSQALKQDPGSAEAHFGAALCIAGQIGDSLDNIGSGGAPGSTGVGSVSPGSTASTPSGLFSSGNTSSAFPPAAPGSPPALPSHPTTGDVPPVPPGHTLPPSPLPPRHTLSLLWNLDSGLANPYTLLNILAPISDLQHGLIPFYGYGQDNADVARRQKLLADLNTVIQHLQAVEADAGFTTTLPDPGRQGAQVTVGLPEVHLFAAYVQSLRTEVALSLAYIRDPGGYQIIPTPVPVSGAGGIQTTAGAVTPPSPPIFATRTKSVSRAPTDPGAIGAPSPFVGLDKNGDGKLIPAEYLPPSPYLTLRDPALLQTAQQAMAALVDEETSGINGVLARPANGAFLVSNTPEIARVLGETRDKVLPVLKQAATGPVTVDVPHFDTVFVSPTSSDAPPPAPFISQGVFIGQPPTASGSSAAPAPPLIITEPVTINLSAWFKNPPADLKVFAPTYTLNSDGFPNDALTAYPDSTFGGLYPNGLPKNLLF